MIASVWRPTRQGLGFFFYTGSALAPVGSACVSGANSCIDLLGAGASKGIDLLGAGASKAGGALASVPTRVSVFFNRVPL